MILYPAVIMRAGNISVVRSIRKLGPVLLLVCAVGIANPFFDRAVTLSGRTFACNWRHDLHGDADAQRSFAVLASYLLILTTSMESICYALRLLHVPKIMVTMVLLIYRYVIVLLKEAERISSVLIESAGSEGNPLPGMGDPAGTADVKKHRPGPDGL